MSDELKGKVPDGSTEEPTAAQPSPGELPGALRGNEGLEGSLPTLHDVDEGKDGEEAPGLDDANGGDAETQA
jgi:hypothetical protein